MARPRKQVDLEQLTLLAKMNCSHAEIAAVLRISVRLLETRFYAAVESARQEGKASLKRKMWECAMGRREKKIVLVKVKKEVKQADGSVQKLETMEPREVDHIYEPNTGMQIWLSKQMLGYTDKIEEKTEAHIEGDISYETQWSQPIVNDPKTKP